ncbi:MAG: nucleic acid-binding protein [Propionibacteriaceae bacterium]|nr:nucleic acid-binding protein [Propionibacteriaceae bacterium]
MKADPTDLMRLYDVQTLDTAIDKIKHKALALPIHAQIAALLTRRTQIGDEVIAAKTALSDATSLAQRSEADVVPVRERLVRNQKRVDEGLMDPKALPAALEEIQHLKQRISDLEDTALETMEAMESAQATFDDITAQAGGLEAELHKLVEQRDTEVSHLAGESKELSKERAQTAQPIAADLMALYEKIRTRASGIGIAKLEGRRCLGCDLEATVADYNSYLKAAPDEVLRCAECDRILMR